MDGGIPPSKILTACFEVQSGLPSPPRLLQVVPDVTWAESLSERTFHGNEVRVMVLPPPPGAKGLAGTER